MDGNLLGIFVGVVCVSMGVFSIRYLDRVTVIIGDKELMLS